MQPNNEQEQRGRGRPRKNQPSYSFKPPVYNSPLGYQYTQPIFFNINMSVPAAVPQQQMQSRSYRPQKDGGIITQADYSYEPRVKRAAALKSVKQIRKNKKVMESESDTIESENVSVDTQVEEDPYEKLLQRKDNKFLVKFRNMSYLHCDWVDEEEITKTRAGTIKVKKFKPSEINPDYLKVEKVLAEGRDDENKETYMVKWKNMAYELSTVELFEDVKKAEGFEDALNDLKERKRMRHSKYPLDWRPPKGAQMTLDESPEYKNRNKLRTYQLEGVNWLLNRWHWNSSCIMADEMGLGKTVQSVCFVQALSAFYDYNHPIIVVAPLSTVVHWEREFAAWTDLRVLTYHGTIEGRDVIAEYEFTHKSGNIDVRLFDVIITTYEMVMSGMDHLNQFDYSVAVIDEAHRLKNSRSKASKALRNLKINHKVLLTGTPIQNNLTELWALFNFIDPQRFFDLDVFLNEYKLTNAKDVDKLQAVLKPLMLRRMKEDVETSIPMKEETIIEVELTMTQKRYYRAILEKNFEFLANNNKKNFPNLINAMMELRKCCIHPYLLKGAEDPIIKDYMAQKRIPNEHNQAIDFNNMVKNDLYYQILIQSSGKLVLLDKLLNKLHGKHKVLIFSQMTKCLDLLAEYLEYRRYKYERIDGGVRGDLRQTAIDRFSTEDSFVFLLCTRAGGVGINLTAADTCVIFDSDWNPQNDLQAQARCHRIGQKNQVKIYRLVTKNSYEREMFDKAGMKLGLDKAVLQKMTYIQDDKNEANETNKEQQEKSQNKDKGEMIQMLLRKGAYGVLMDQDDDGDQFCEEDIDQILERRTKVIKHADGGNVFSKATFQVEEEVDDPFFWDNLLNTKKNTEKEGRIKRQCRKLSRDGGLSEEDYADLKKEFEKINEVKTKEKEVYKLFLDILINGFKNKKDKFDLTKSIVSEDIKQLYKYCVDLISSEKIKMDFMEQMDNYMGNYDVELYETFSSVYLKYHEQFMFRIQVAVLMNKMIKQIDGVEKARGFSKENDKEICQRVVEEGYGYFTLKGKTVEEINQRVRKILSVLYNKKEVKDYDNLYLKAIVNFGRVTVLNKDSVEKYIERDTTNLEELIEKICQMSKRARKDTPEADCYERIQFFENLEEMNEFPVIRKTGMPKNWNSKKDEDLRMFLLTEGFERVYEEYNLTEDVVVKRFEQLFKKN